MLSLFLFLFSFLENVYKCFRFMKKKTPEKVDAMDVEKRYRLVRDIAEEVIQNDELKKLLEEKDHIIAYDGFEPSGLCHLPFGIYRPLLLKNMVEAKIHFKLLLADSFAWVNDKMGGDLEKIREVGKYFIEVWKTAGVDMNKVEVVWHKEHFDDPEYWKKVILISKNHTLQRTIRSLAIAGRVGTEGNPAAYTFYPSMQCADIFHLEAEICQLGMDQRKVNMLAREVGPRLGWFKPVAVHHHLLMGLEGPQQLEGFDDESVLDREISSKMSKSVAETSIYVHDTLEDIERKINKAYCPPKTGPEENPIMDYVKEIIFRAFDKVVVERDTKYGGDIEYEKFSDLESDYYQGKLHPLDLKQSTALYIDNLVKPLRTHFERVKSANELYQFVKESEVTR